MRTIDHNEIVNPPLINPSVINPQKINIERKPMPPSPYNPNENEEYMKCFKKACEISYEREFPPNQDIWQTPNNTIKRGKGDCEDISFYIYDLLKKANIDSKVVIGYMNGNLNNGHSWVELKRGNDTLILDGSIKKIFVKEKLRIDPNCYDYKDYPSYDNMNKEINDFIKRFESDDDRNYVRRIGWF